jgi:hypothetical protein
MLNSLEQIQHISNAGMTEHIAVAGIVIVGVISVLVSIFKIYKGIDKRIDERIDARIKPSLEVLQETVAVVKSLEHTVAEMNATLTILKEILLMTHGGKQ